jgi:hypothetical protein
VHSRTRRHLHRFQVQEFAASRREDHPEKRLDFTRDFAMNGSSRFFSTSVHPD